jgi:hypothetical protein
VVDLSAVTDADPGLLAALSRLQRGVERHHHASLTFSGAPDALAVALETATLAQAFLIYRSVQAPPDPVAGSIDPIPIEPGLTTTGYGARGQLE